MKTANLASSQYPLPRALQAALLACMLAGSHPLLAQQAGQSSQQTGTTSGSQTQPATAQNQPAQSQTPSTPPQNQGKQQSNSTATPAPTQLDPNVPKNDRILWTLPNYLTVENASSLPPLTARQKFKLVAEGTFDPIEIAFLAAESGVNQATNADPTFGQGLKGYGKRFALQLADNTVENFMVGAVFPAALHQDPRYYQLGKGSFVHRVEYAAERAVITRSDAGKAEFNFSEVFGAASAAAISTSYHPGPRTVGSGISIWWTQIGWDTVGFEAKEFWPDIRRYLHKSTR